MRVSSDHGGLLLIIAFLGQKDLLKRVAYLFITRPLIWCKLALRLFLGFSITHLNPCWFFCSVQNRKQQWSVCSFPIKHFFYYKNLCILSCCTICRAFVFCTVILHVLSQWQILSLLCGKWNRASRTVNP